MIVRAVPDSVKFAQTNDVDSRTSTSKKYGVILLNGKVQVSLNFD